VPKEKTSPISRSAVMLTSTTKNGLHHSPASSLPPISPFKNLRVSDPSPIPPSPHRKRQNMLRDFASDEEDFWNLGEGSASKDELTRFRSPARLHKSSASPAKQPRNENNRASPFFSDGQPPLLPTSPRKKSSLSQPASPNHLMPAKWRLKRFNKQAVDSGLQSSSSANNILCNHHSPVETGKHGSTNKNHAIASETKTLPEDTTCFYNNINQTEQTVKAYQDQDQIIFVAQDASDNNVDICMEEDKPCNKSLVQAVQEIVMPNGSVSSRERSEIHLRSASPNMPSRSLASTCHSTNQQEISEIENKTGIAPNFCAALFCCLYKMTINLSQGGRILLIYASWLNYFFHAGLWQTRRLSH